MTREALLADIDESVRQFSAANAARDAETTGLPRPPQVVINDTQIETEPFNFELNRGSGSQALRGGQGGSVPPPVCTPPNHLSLFITSFPQSACCLVLSDGKSHQFDGFGDTYFTEVPEISDFVWGFTFPDYWFDTPVYDTGDCSGDFGRSNLAGGIEVLFDPETCLWTFKEFLDDGGTIHFDFLATADSIDAAISNSLASCTGSTGNWGCGGSWAVSQ